MKVSKKVWGVAVFALGFLWLVGGVFGFAQNKGGGTLVLIFCGIVLSRMGWGMMQRK